MTTRTEYGGKDTLQLKAETQN